MKQLPKGLILLAAFLILSSEPVWGLCVWRPLEDDLSSAEYIFVGTVATARPYRTPLTIETAYTFQDVRNIRGVADGEEVVLTQEGGTVGNSAIFVEDAPQFEVGHRYVVLANDWQGHRKAWECGGSVPFELCSDSTSAAPSAYMNASRVVLFDDRHIVVVEPNREERPGIVSYSDWNGRVLYSGPPRSPVVRSVSEVIRDADSLYAERHGPDGNERDLIRTIRLYSAEDPGGAVTEDELVQRLSSLVARLSRTAEPSKDQPR